MAIASANVQYIVHIIYVFISLYIYNRWVGQSLRNVPPFGKNVKDEAHLVGMQSFPSYMDEANASGVGCTRIVILNHTLMIVASHLPLEMNMSSYISVCLPFSLNFSIVHAVCLVQVTYSPRGEYLLWPICIHRTWGKMCREYVCMEDVWKSFYGSFWDVVEVS